MWLKLIRMDQDTDRMPHKRKKGANEKTWWYWQGATKVVQQSQQERDRFSPKSHREIIEPPLKPQHKAAEMSPTDERVATKKSTESHHKNTKMPSNGYQWRSNKGANERPPRCDQDAIERPWKSHQNVIEKPPRWHQNTTKMALLGYQNAKCNHDIQKPSRSHKDDIITPPGLRG